MLDDDSLAACLRDVGLDQWPQQLKSMLRERLSDAAHGDFRQWRETVERLPRPADFRAELAGDVVAVGVDRLGNTETQALKLQLLGLSPWRKGPFDVCGVRIDAEWRSDLKWRRLSDKIAPLDGRNVLDVGCGNGYYAMRMRGQGARNVIGIDPTILYVMQFLAISHFMDDRSIHVLPLRLHELPGGAHVFDTVFSMGVLYHQRAPIDHLRQLKDTLRPGGQLVLETIILPGEEALARTPAERYARMRNIWLLPTISELLVWLNRTGYRDAAVVDVSLTTSDEQRTTEWMSFDSLAEALAPDDPTRTVEGWPAPRRVIVTATAP
ncbi:MAG: tRNA 5-methoxyuridine(34)/uridine 5-oxyacetic acid(34) synthase CmoB [Woeseiaceae bacterium]